ncbi:hypothetical protein ALC56_08265 [Trachymyrmex septentrionalis]|uniref:Uncharacterized protein n=1 Tax=Trachymyrmex septentrionalis TaxID=34720 RepID=A0A151JV42_9HYME|nr:hypothetical protein ALC56_08265 [Trachymyrmex septentrionalis]
MADKSLKPVTHVIKQMDSKDVANRTNQCNPTHTPSGPGHKAGYTGKGDKADLDNHAKQLDPNNPSCKK